MPDLDPKQVGREAAAKLHLDLGFEGTEHIRSGKGDDANVVIHAAIAGATEMLARMGGAERRGFYTVHIEDLRKWVTVHEFAGNRCAICDSHWLSVEPEHHNSGCPLSAAPAPDGEVGGASAQFSKWLNDGPKLAKAAGCYVGITVSELAAAPAGEK